jgi:RhtB (resistance to homoserine/threonine) family protein
VVHVDLVSFLALSVLLIVIPGPDTAVVTKNALLGGRGSGLFASAGVALGLSIWTIGAAFGIAALLKASAVAFLALKIAGAIYLTWLGIQMLRSRSAATGVGGRRNGNLKALRQGLLSDLSNPKIAIFFTSFLPQFIHGHHEAFASLLTLGGIFVALTFVWLATYAVIVGRASAFLRRERVRKALDRFTGVVLIAFGVRLALERR